MRWVWEVIYEKLGELESSRTSTSREYDLLLECLQIRYTDGMAMAMVMMSSERKPPSMAPSQN
jgi:hypothetical protein